MNLLYDCMCGTDGFLFVITGVVSDNIFAGNDTDETIEVIYNGDEVLVHGIVQQFFHGDGDADRRVAVFAENVADVQMLHGTHGTALLRVGVIGEKSPEKITLADCAYVLSVTGDDGDGGITMVPHFLQSLTKCEVIIKVSDIAFGNQKISNIHWASSFLERESACYTVLYLIIVYRKKPRK